MLQSYLGADRFQVKSFSLKKWLLFT
jgi:hypothetical protein